VSDKPTILIVDDEKNTREGLARALRGEYAVAEAENGLRALAWLETHAADVVLSDLRMPGMDGMELLRNCRTQYPQLGIVVISAHGTVETAVEAMKLGAVDFFPKPFDNQEVLRVVDKCLDACNLDQQPHIPAPEQKGFHSIVGASPAMQQVYALMAKVARTDSTVLILGESGTGKELVARNIHEQSNRAAEAFIAVNCAALPENLVESELFGHEKGAFTGAANAKPGRFELACGGTLFLDEVGEIPPPIQAKLLRVLQERSYERVGGIKTMKADVRLVAATNRNLEQEVTAGRFREDLFYRLNVVPVQLPPLRRRAEDIELLANYFVEIFNRRMKRAVGRIDPSLLGILRAYSWPGNVRELENTIERMMVLSEGESLDCDSLPERVRNSKPGDELPSQDKDALRNHLRLETDRVEKDLLEQTLRDCAGNRSLAAKCLGVSRKTVHNKIREYGLE